MSAEEKAMLSSENNSVSDEDLDSVSGGEGKKPAKRGKKPRIMLNKSVGKYAPLKKSAVNAVEDDEDDDDDDEDGEPEFEPGPAKMIKVDL